LTTSTKSRSIEFILNPISAYAYPHLQNISLKNGLLLDIDKDFIMRVSTGGCVMSFKDISSRLKSARQDKDESGGEDRPFDHDESYRLRAKMVGVLLRDARLNAHRTLEDCANMLRVTPAEIEAWELGDAVPNLPQLELIALYLDVPVSHFWGMETLESHRHQRLSAQEEYLSLRNRMIGALLRAAREEMNQSIEDLSQATVIPADRIYYYEYGELPIPMHELTVLANGVNKNVSYFLESSSQIGELLATRESWKHFNELPEELRLFAANPRNIGFIEIALAFSQMPSDKLKNIGVSILDITR
jgi:transcriptional regulator with XRE-family HTH domain